MRTPAKLTFIKWLHANLHVSTRDHVHRHEHCVWTDARGYGLTPQDERSVEESASDWRLP